MNKFVNGLVLGLAAAGTFAVVDVSQQFVTEQVNEGETIMVFHSRGGRRAADDYRFGDKQFEMTDFNIEIIVHEDREALHLLVYETAQEFNSPIPLLDDINAFSLVNQ